MKRLSKIKWFSMGMAVCLIISIFIVPALAASFVKTADLHYNNIGIKLNGQTIIPKDGNGNAVDPFIIDGTTYLPVRAVSSALGLEVDWDSATDTVLLTGAPVSENLSQYIQVLKIYQIIRNVKEELDLTYQRFSNCLMAAIDTSIPYDTYTTALDSINLSVKSGGRLEKLINSTQQEVNWLSGDRWVANEKGKMTDMLSMMSSALVYMRVAADEIPNIESSGVVTKKYAEQMSHVDTGLYTLKSSLNSRIFSVFDKISSSTAG